jgi:hypothetical protein
MVLAQFFELRSLRLRNYHLIYRLSPNMRWFVLDFPAPMNIGVGSL